MGDREDSKGLVYVGIGILAAVGASYLVWRYVLTDEQKAKARQAVAEAATMTKDATLGLLQKGKENGRDVADHARGAAKAVAARGAQAVERRAHQASGRLQE